jgi:DNA-nicking Smr family endonuclease
MGSEGALRRAVPLWFSKPEFRFLISSYEWAARHHGGDGALYVRLARVDRSSP